MNQSHRWTQRGTVSLWRYRENARNYPGWHLSADNEGCASLILLVDTLMADAAGAMRTVQVTAPSEAVLSVPNNRRAAVEVPSRLCLLRAATDDAWVWHLDAGRLTLELGADHAPALTRGIRDIAAGDGDYSIRPADAECLWFWWWPWSSAPRAP